MGINLRGTVSSELNHLARGASGIYDQAKQWIGSLVDGVGSKVQSAVNGDVIGIKAAEIPEMQRAITKYINDVNAAMEQFASQLDTSTAFAGGHSEQIKGYVVAVSTACSNVTSNMKYFNDRLTAIREAFEKRNADLASQFTDNASDIKSRFQEYVSGSNAK